ncbi:hypothetical protein GGS26DRAFT_353764 [Hypomontagnella submonticulosa]|nr:hypothetical protein GGS26DRAFT_353764 [Hypomontagnella submonticulosa]
MTFSNAGCLLHRFLQGPQLVRRNLHHPLMTLFSSVRENAHGFGALVGYFPCLVLVGLGSAATLHKAPLLLHVCIARMLDIKGQPENTTLFELMCFPVLINLRLFIKFRSELRLCFYRVNEPALQRSSDGRTKWEMRATATETSHRRRVGTDSYCRRFKPSLFCERICATMTLQLAPVTGGSRCTTVTTVLLV